MTHDYIAIRISERTCSGIEEAIAHLKSEYGEARFSQVFKTITVDNGTEFETFTQLGSLDMKVYFAPPIAHGNALRMSVTTASSANIFPKERASTDTLTRTS